MIPKSFVQDLLSRVDIVDVIESYIPLKRAGTNLKACCPFHNEKSPSFTVSPTKQFYHCFGCGAHGTAVGFLMEYSGLGYVEAVKDLAQRVGMQVPDVRGPRVEATVTGEESAEILLDVLRRAAGYFKAELKKSERAVTYLKGRGMTGDIAAHYGLGYAPPGWQGLSSVFPNYGDRSLVAAGLVIQSDDGKRYDRFRDRIMFPIVSQRGQIIGFGGRVLDKSEPKYLNSPETPVFEKRRELYGLFQARQGIRTAGCVLVVEGYMDVVALAQYDVTNAVATLGTATTPWHLQKLLRQTDEIVFCFDGDAAGRRAAWRALDVALDQVQDGKRVKFLFLPSEHDPDSFVRAEGRPALLQKLSQAIPLSQFLVAELTATADLQSEEGRGAVVEAAKPLVAKIGAPILRIGVIDRLVQRVGEAQGQALLALKPIERRASLTPTAPSSEQAKRSPTRVAYRKLVKCFLSKPELLRRCGVDKFPDPEPEADVVRALLAQADEIGKDLAAWLDQARSSRFGPLLLELNNEALSEWGPTFDVDGEFEGALRTIEGRSRDQALAELLRDGEREGWTPERKEALRRLQSRPIKESESYQSRD